MHTLLMVPVLYGASKLVASHKTHSSLGIACIILVPLPVLIYWIYILWRFSTDQPEAHNKTSTSRLYLHGEESAGTTLNAKPATLDLLGSGEDNPTLVLREVSPGDNDYHTMDSASDDELASPGTLPAARPQSHSGQLRTGNIICTRHVAGGCQQPPLLLRMASLPGEAIEASNPHIGALQPHCNTKS